MENVPVTNQPQPAVPATPPQPQQEMPQSEEKPKPPVMKLAIIVGVILLGGFMTYNFIIHQLTQLAGVSTGKHSHKHKKYENSVLSPTPTVYQVTPTPEP